MDIGRFACGDPEAGTDITEINEQVTMVATAAAEAVASIRATCAVRGNGRISTTGSARAMAQAEAYGRAVSDVFIANDACPNCTAVVEAVVGTSMRVIDEATAEAWIQARLRTCARASAVLNISTGYYSLVVHEHIHFHIHVCLLSCRTSTLHAVKWVQQKHLYKSARLKPQRGRTKMGETAVGCN